MPEPSDAELIDADGEEIQPTTAALVPVMPSGALTRPIASVDDVRAAFEQYEQLRKTIVVAADVTIIQGKQFVNKSGWRKLAVVMGVSSTIVSRDYQRDAHGRVMSAEVIVRAVSPNGRTMDGLGICDFHERCCPKAFGEDAVCKDRRKSHSHCAPGCDGFNHFSKPQHDIPATASTRALNRACSDLFGFGEVSAEEVMDREEPADDETRQAVIDAMNRIADEGQRKGTKHAFVGRFGQPTELKKGQVAEARRFVTSAGGSFDASPPSAGVDRQTGEIAGGCLCAPSEEGFVNPDCPVHGSGTAAATSPSKLPVPSDAELPPCDQDASDTPSKPTETADPYPLPEPDPVETLKAEVAAMSSDALYAELGNVGLSQSGAPKALRARLLAWRVQKAAEARQVSPIY